MSSMLQQQGAALPVLSAPPLGLDVNPESAVDVALGKGIMVLIASAINALNVFLNT